MLKKNWMLRNEDFERSCCRRNIQIKSSGHVEHMKASQETKVNANSDVYRNLVVIDDILGNAPTARCDFKHRLRGWLSSLLRGEATPFWGWSFALPVLQVGVPHLVGLFISWKDAESAPPVSLVINGNWVGLKWSATGEKEILIPSSSWRLHENIVAAKAPIDWTKLTICPAVSKSQIDQEQVGDKKLDFSGASYHHPDTVDHTQDPIERAVSFMVNSVNRDPASVFQGLCYGCYDLTNEGYRLSSWVWTSGIVISALLSSRSNDLFSLATRIGDASLRFLIDDGKNVGALMVRHDPITDVRQGYAEWLAPNDAALFGGYGLLPLFRLTRNRHFWDAAVGIADWIRREGIRNSKLRVGYRLEQNQWDDSWLYVDAGFTPVLFAGLYEIEQRPEWKQSCELIMDDLLTRLYHEDGRLYSSWLWPGRKGKPLFARGYAWFLDGVIHSYRCTGRSDYLEVAKQCAQFLQRYQAQSGAWYYLLDKPGTGFCNKGTPAIAWQLLQLYRLTGQEELKLDARRALDWCTANQYMGDDVNARGGIVSWNTEGAIVGAKNIKTAFPYASGFQVLAESLWRELI